VTVGATVRGGIVDVLRRFDGFGYLLVTVAAQFELVSEKQRILR
jgi:hypothetical protein